MVLHVLELGWELCTLLLEICQLFIKLRQLRFLLLLLLEEIVDFCRPLLMLFIREVLPVLDPVYQILYLFAVMVEDSLDLGRCLLCLRDRLVTSLDLGGQAVLSQQLILKTEDLLAILAEDLLNEELAIAHFANVANLAIGALWKDAPLGAAPGTVCLGAELTVGNIE